MNEELLTVKKNRISFLVLLYICLFILFVSTVMDRSGKLAFAAFIFDMLLIVGVTQSLWSLLYFFVAILPNFTITTGSISVLSILRVVLMITLIMLAITRFPFRSFKKKMFVSLPFLMLWFLFVFINEIGIGMQSAVSVLSIFLMYIICMLTEIKCSEGSDEAEKFVTAFIAGISFIVLVACIELLIGKTFFYSIWTGAERYRNGILRPGSTVADPNNICFAIVPFFYLLFSSSVKRVLNDNFRKLLITLTCVVIVCTSSRTGFVAWIIGIFFYYFAKRKLYVWLGLSSVILSAKFLIDILIRLFSKHASSQSFRQYMVDLGLEVWNKSKIWGVGSGRFFSELKAVDVKGLIGTSANTMNTYVYTLVCYGIIGILFYIAYWFFIMKNDLKDWMVKKIPDNDGLLRMSAVITLIVIAYTLDTYRMFVMWLIPAFFVSMRIIEENTAKERCDGKHE